MLELLCDITWKLTVKYNSDLFYNIYYRLAKVYHFVDSDSFYKWANKE